MKKISFLLLITVLGSVAFAQQKTFLDVPYIEVNGNADTLVTPNEIFIKIMIAEADVKNKIPLEEQERKMVGGLKLLGINTEKDLTTSDMQSNFKYYVLKQKDVMKSKEYTLKVGDAVLATKVFIKLEELGISNASVEKVGYSDMENMKNTCRMNAILNARQKAIALTKPIGALVGPPVHISDYSNDDLYAASPIVRIRGAVMMKDQVSAEPLPQIDFEKIKISVSVNAKFMLK